MDLVDIVIPVYGQAKLTRRAVESVLATTRDTHIYIVDDCSPGAEINHLAIQWRENLRISFLRTPHNMGFIGSTRLGAQSGKAPFVLFLNSDTEAFEAGWLERMVPKEKDIAVAGALLLFPPEAPQPWGRTIQHAGIARFWKGAYHPFLGSKADLPAVMKLEDVNAVTGACFCIRRDLWDAAGGWDGRFGRGIYEDVDLCWRLRRQGYRVVLRNDARLYHIEGASRSMDGQHLLYDKWDENLNILRAIWGNLESDEAIFFGPSVVEKWERLRSSIFPSRQPAGSAAAAGVVDALLEFEAIPPDLLEVMVEQGKWMSEQGNHKRSAEILQKVSRFVPANLGVQIKTMDEWWLGGEPEKAREILRELQKIIPDAGEVHQRERLLGVLPKEKQPSEKTKWISEDTFQILLESNDLVGDLKKYENRLDQNLLNLVRKKQVEATQDGEIDLAEGLGNLANYIQNVLTH